MANIIKVGGSGGGSSVIVSKTITTNDTYYASADSADGYNPVIVNVSGGSSFDTIAIHSGKINLTTGEIIADNDFYYTDLFNAPNGYMIFDLGEVNNSIYVGVEMCSSSGANVNYWSVNARFREVNHGTYYAQAPKLRLTFQKIYLDNVFVLDKANDIVYAGKPVIVGE